MAYKVYRDSTDELITTFANYNHAKAYADNFALANGGVHAYVVETKMVYTTKRVADAETVLDKARQVRKGE